MGVKLHFTAFASISQDSLGFSHFSLSEGQHDTPRKQAGSGFKPPFPPAPQSARLCGGLTVRPSQGSRGSGGLARGTPAVVPSLGHDRAQLQVLMLSFFIGVRF